MSKQGKNQELGIMQIRFCEAYLTELVGRQAAIKAGYSVKTADSQANRLLKNAKVLKRIAELRAEEAERNKVSIDDVIQELKALGFWSINDFLNEDNTIKKLGSMNRHLTKPVVGIKVTEKTSVIKGKQIVEVITELKLADKQAALVSLGKHLGAFKEDNEQKKITIKVTKK